MELLNELTSLVRMWNVNVSKDATIVNYSACCEETNEVMKMVISHLQENQNDENTVKLADVLNIISEEIYVSQRKFFSMITLREYIEDRQLEIIQTDIASEIEESIEKIYNILTK